RIRRGSRRAAAPGKFGPWKEHNTSPSETSHCRCRCVTPAPLHLRSLKWPPLSRPFLDRNKLRIGGAGLRSGAAEAALAIPALESALRSHSCVALSSAQVPLL